MESATASRLSHDQVHQALVQAFPNAGLAFRPGNVPSTVVPVEALHAVLLHLRDDPRLRFDYPGCITAIDYMDDFELIYQLRSMSHHHDVNLTCRLEREQATAPSSVDIWPGADFQEREVYDMFGIRFEGHPNLTRILLWDEFVGYPLRKDYGLPAPLPPDVEQALQRGELLNPPARPGPRALDERGAE
jgi:NADH:ubiquinone oxidoreductase subunit C